MTAQQLLCIELGTRAQLYEVRSSTALSHTLRRLRGPATALHRDRADPERDAPLTPPLPAPPACSKR
jgi:hypothetical protein